MRQLQAISNMQKMKSLLFSETEIQVSITTTRKGLEKS
jgi:hypothetical protein